jgi:hypothetical protein
MKQNFERIHARECNGWRCLKDDFYHSKFGLFQKIIEKKQECEKKYFIFVDFCFL